LIALSSRHRLEAPPKARLEVWNTMAIIARLARGSFRWLRLQADTVAAATLLVRRRARHVGEDSWV